ncbi:Palmitoyltransferase ZDHHC9 [Leucoagaricus sp. SymC.cos]|nr:Palmitoyltransferase ZDHHC9 [Leucoagaricus sp. SymC.cos]
MSSSQQLPFTFPVPPSPSSPRRNSLSQQLPLPTSLNATSTPRPQGGTTISTLTTASSPPASRPLHHGTHRSPGGDIQPPTSPTLSNFAHMHSATHAGGIQPSMSFFRPTRPNNQPEYSRPSSTASISEVVGSHDPDFFQLSDVNHRNSESFDEQVDGSRAADHIYTSVQEDTPTTRRLKQSREPLLPIVDRPSLVGRPSGMRDRSGTNSSYAPKTIVRTSFDKMMGLSRGLSFESLRKVSNNRPALIEGRATFEGKRRDELHGYDLPTSPTHYKRTSSPGMYGDMPGVERRHSGPRTSISHSPDPSFIPRPPDHRPPLSAVPIINPDTKNPYRNYQLHPSNNKFFFGGRILTGGDSPWAFITSFLLVLTIAGVWFGTTCVWWWQNESPAVAAVGIYMALLVISTMLATATTDPGILPRGLDPDPPYSSETPSEGGSRAPMPRDLKVRNDVVRTKYCPTCRTYRPPRSSHCKMCDNCVDGCDHHCQWVNNCVGRRNYTTFFVLLLSATLTLILIICTSALHLYLLTVRDKLAFRHALKRGAGSAVAFCLSILIIWPVSALLLYHMRLLLLNITTIEQIRNQAHKSLIPDAPPPNPFSHGNWRRNLINVLCRPAGYSWLDASAIATEDKREINPALTEGGGGIWDGPNL